MAQKVILFLLMCSLTVVLSDITIEGVRCGQNQCKIDEYCSEFISKCESCGKICDQTTHNFDKSTCEKSCQNYLHDSRFEKIENSGKGDENLKATVQRLSHMITVTLILVCFMLIALTAVFIFQLYRWKKKKNITLATIKSKFFSKKAEPNQTKPSPQPTNNERPDLRLEIPTESTHSGNSPITMTTSISRRPAEDSTLDYAYDNPAMSSSPNNKTSPTRF